MWVVSTLIGTIRKLRDDASGAVVSPDGSRIAFLNGKRNEIWLTTDSSEGARKVATAEQGFRFTELGWGPNGRRIAYLKRQRGDEQYAIETRDLEGGPPVIVFSDPRLRSFVWMNNGRIVYSRMDSTGSTNFSLWEIEIDSGSGRSIGSAHELTRGPGQSFWYLSATADGKRIAFLRWQAQSDVWVGELQNGGKRLTAARRITTDERADWPGAWTRDSKYVLFYSDRNGSFDIYKQAIDEPGATLTVFGPNEERSPQISSDGAWILFLAWPRRSGNSPPSSGRIMRVPMSGGEPSAVIDIQGYPGMAQVKSEGRTRPTARGYPSFRCPSMNTVPCVLAEQKGNQIVFSSIDPTAGSVSEVLREEVSPATESSWDLSPDGTAIAVVPLEEQTGRIRIRRLRTGEARDINVNGWAHLDSVAWAAGGDGLFVTKYSSRGSTLLRVTLDGQTQVLRTSSMWMDTPVPSANGRYLAFGQAVHQSNAWVIETPR